MIRKWREEGVGALGSRLFIAGNLIAMLGYEHGRWHLSLSTKSKRYPTWDEIADARYDLVPREVADMAMVLPRPEDYVNIANVFHLWEVRDGGLPIERGVAMQRTYESGIAPG
jgi:hypothetical protein